MASIQMQQIRKMDNQNYIQQKLIFCFFIYTLFTLLSTTGIGFAFALLNFVFCVYIVLKYDDKVLVPFFVYATFFASLFKVLNITEMSLLTVIMLLYILKKVVYTKKYRARFFVPFIGLLGLQLVIQGANGQIDINRNIKFFETYLYIYFAVLAVSLNENHSDNDNSSQWKSVFVSFVSGVIISSFIRFLDGEIFNISKFVTEKSSTLGIGSIVYVRFSGLYGDPNYYAVNLILGMSITCFMYAKKNIKPWIVYVLLFLFTVLSILTRSKSAFLMLCLPILMMLYINHKQHNTFLQILLIISLGSVIILVASGRILWFSSITNRFVADTDLNALTTGRTGIWTYYINYLRNNPIKLLFGNGLSASILGTRGTHNTYLDILYYLGIIPGLFYVYMVFSLFRLNGISIKRNFINYCGIITISIMYFFLGCLFDIDMSTNIIIMIIMYNTTTNSCSIPVLENLEV